jgi:hypothetical protein
MTYFGNERYLGPFGWPDVRLTGSGCIGVVLALLGAIILIGGLFRGLF